MGLGDIGAKILFTLKGDNSDLKAKLREVAGEEKKLAEQTLKNAEDKNKALEKSIATFAKVTVAIGAIGVAGKIAFDAIEFSGRRADLTAAAGSVSIDRLRKATLGLRTDTQLLEMAAKLNNSQFKLTQEQMDLAARAATALAERGGDAEEAFDAITTALVSGTARGLAPYGMAIDETKDKASKFAEIMRQVSKVSGEVSESSLDASDKIGQQKVAFANIFDTVKDGIGRAASEMLPLLKVITDVATSVAQFVDVAAALGAVAKYGIPVYGQLLLARDAMKGNVFDIAKGYANQGGDPMAAWNAGRALGSMNIRPAAAGDIEMPAAFVGRVPKGKKGGSGSNPDADARDRADDDTSMIQSLIDEQARMAAELDELTGQEFSDGDSLAVASAKRSKERIAAVAEDMAKMKTAIALTGAEYDANQPTILERMFGKREEIDAYRETWSGLMGVVSAGYLAMVDGSMSFGQAAKRAAGDAIKALGLKMLIEGAEQTATGIKMLAGGWTAAKAPGHFAAAAKYFAGAALAGVAANALGSGGGGGGGGGGGASGGYRPSAPSGGQDNQERSSPTIVVGSAFAYDSPRNQVKNAKRLVTLAAGTNSVVYG